MMTMAELTDLFSRVMRERPALTGDRNVALFIQDSIEIVRQRPAPPTRRLPFAPVDVNDR